MGLKHTTQATGVNNPAKQVSVDVWNEAHTVIESLDFPDIVYPTTPILPASGVGLFNQVLMGEWYAMGFIDISARIQYLSPHLARHNIYKLVPAGGTANTNFAVPVGHTITATANTFSAQTPTAGSDISTSLKYRVAANTTSGTAVDIRPTAVSCSRQGGFAFSTTFKLATTSAANFTLFGLVNTSNALGATTNWLTSTTNSKIAMAMSSNTGNWSLIHNVAGTAPTVTNLGTDFPVNTTNFYKFSLFCTPTDTTFVWWQAENLTDGLFASGTIDTNLPTVTTMMAPHQFHTNNSNGVAVAFDSTGYYLQTNTI